MLRKRTILFAMALFFAATGAASAATLTVVNNTDVYITVNVDGSYGCNTAGHTTCTIQVSEGNHALTASDADGHSVTQNANIDANGFTWTIS